MSMIVVFAHLGHWYVGLPVYLGPVVVITVLVKATDWRERHRRGARASSAAPAHNPIEDDRDEDSDL